MTRKRLYRWEEWFGRPRTTIVRGVDYACSQGVMWQMVRNEAWRRRKRIRVTDHNDRLVIEVIGDIPNTRVATTVAK